MAKKRRMRKTIPLLCLAVAAAMIFILTACRTETTNVSFGGGASFADGAVSDGGSYQEGDVFVLPECSLVREGYAFRGWSDGENVYQPGDSYTVGKKSVQFTAVWVAEKLSVTFLNYDGSVLWHTTVSYGQGLPWGYEGEEPEAPEAEIGSRYLWNASDGWEPAIPQSFSSDTVLTAKFELVKENYRYRFYNSVGEKYREYFGTYGDAMKAPAKPPVKSVPSTEVHVDRYEFKGWKRDGEADSAARLPDENGDIGTVTGEDNFYPVYEQVLKIYTLRVAETPEGAVTETSGGVSVGGSFQITVTLEEAYRRSAPYAYVEFSETEKVKVTLVGEGNGVLKGVVENIQSDGVVRVYGVEKNRYSAAVSVKNAEVTGLSEGYAHGETAAFTVVPDPHYTNATPVVKVNGVAIAGRKIEEGGKISYEYTLFMTDDAKIEIEAIVNQYQVTFVGGDGEILSQSYYPAGSALKFPEKADRSATDEYEYIFSHWAERDGKVEGEFAGGTKLDKVADEYTFDAIFRAERRSYSVRFGYWNGADAEEVVVVEYGKTLSETLRKLKESGKDLEADVVRIEVTHTFDGWRDETGTEVGTDTVVTGERAFSAHYLIAPTKYRLTYRYQSGGAAAETTLQIDYGTRFSALKEQLPLDDREGEGKYPVWSADGNEITDEFKIVNDTVVEVSYRVFVYTVEFYNEKGELVPDWTVSVEWGNAAAEPPIVKEWRDAEYVYTLERWSRSFDSVKENLVVRPEYAQVPRVYTVTYRNETGAEFAETEGEKTYRSELKFTLSLDDSIDAAAVKVLANGTELFKNDQGVYTVVIVEDTEIYLEGVGIKKLVVTLPKSETYAAEAVDSVVVEYGKSFRFRVVNGAAYSDAIPEVKANGVTLSPVDGVYTVENVKENIIVKIPNLPVNAYAATWEKGDGIVSVTADKDTVLYDTAVVFTVTLQTGYENAGLKYETQAAGVTVENAGNVYTVTVKGVKADFSIRFYGQINRYTVRLDGTHFTAETNSVTLSHGETFSAAFTVDEFYDRALPTASDARAKIEKSGNRTFCLVVERVLEDMTITVTPSLNVYEVDVQAGEGIAPDGSVVREIRHGDGVEIEFALTIGYDRAEPVVSVSDEKAFHLIKTQNGWKISIDSVTSDTVVSIHGVLNVYTVTLPSESDQKTGEYTVSGAGSAVHGSDYEFTVTLSASNNQTPPAVTLDDGTVLTAVKKENDAYRYRVTAVSEEYIVFVKPRINEYIVTFVNPDGTETIKTVPHYQTVSAPDVRELKFNEQETYADYVTGWKIGDKTYPTDFAEHAVTAHTTYTSTSKTRYFAAKIGDVKYFYFETALENAKEGDTVELLKPGADTAIETGGGKTVTFDRFGDKKEYEIKKGVTVKLPYGENAYSVFTEGDKTRYNTAAVTAFADTNPNLLYFVLRLPADYILNCYGTLEIGGIVSQPGIKIQGHTSGSYAEFDVDGQLNIYGTLMTFGYVKGKGSVDALSGASVAVPFVVKDYRGGTNTVTVAYKNDQNHLICPFNLYEMPNVQPQTYTIRYGAKISGFASLYASSAHNATIAAIISTAEDENAALIKLSENAKIEKKFDAVTHKSFLKFFGNFEDGELYLKISVGSASSKSFLLPISYQYDIVLAKGAAANLSMRYKWMPGSSLTVEDGAVLNLNAGSEIIGYEEYTVTVNQGYKDDFKTTEYNVFYKANLPASLKINGILNLNAASTFGGLVSGSGTVNVGSDAVCSTSSQEGNSGDTGAFSAILGGGKFYVVYETTQTARGTVNGALVEFQPGNAYVLS